jgi:hypothetical protein
VQDLWKQWVAKLCRCTSPTPIRWHRRARGASFVRVTSTPREVPVRLRLCLRMGELVLDSGTHRMRARDSSFPHLRPQGGAQAWEALPANP